MSSIWQCSAFLIIIFFKFFSSLVILAVTILGILVWKKWKIKRTYDGFPSYALDSELVRPILIERQEFDHFTNFIFQKIVKGCRKFENEGLCLIWGLYPYLFVFSDEYVKILSNEEAAVNKPWLYEDILKEAFGDGVVTSNGVTWKKSRKLITAGLPTSVIKQSMKAFNENAKLLVKKMATIADETPEDIIGMLKKCCLDNFFESAMGVKLRSPDNDSKLEDCTHNFSKLFKFTVRRFIFPWLHCKPFPILVATYREHLKYYEEFRRFTEFVVEEMGKAVSACTQADTTVGDECRKSLSQLLFERCKKDPTFTLKNLQEEVSTLIIAGHDTVSYSMLWCLFMLGHHQDVQDKVYEEIKYLPEGDLAYEDVSKLTYMTCVIKESLRLYPTVPLYARQLSKEVKCGKYLVPKGTDIIILSYLLHRNPNYYPDPEEFNPDRFSIPSGVRPWSFVPFSEGIRDCLGKRFAMVEMKVLLTHIIRNFNIISLTDPNDVDLCWDIMLTPARPLLFKLRPRHLNGYS